MDKNNLAQIEAPSFYKLGASLIYEVLTVIALSFVFSALFVWVAGDATQGFKRFLLQFFLWLAIGAYYVRCWVKSGQTLAMQAWRLKLVDKKNAVISLKMAVLRYILATMSLLLLGIGFLWAFFDKDRLFLHDRLLKSTITSVQKTQSK